MKLKKSIIKTVSLLEERFSDNYVLHTAIFKTSTNSAYCHFVDLAIFFMSVKTYSYVQYLNSLLYSLVRSCVPTGNFVHV